MQKSGGAVIPMRESEALEFLLGNEEVLCHIREQKPMVPFADETILFLERVSSYIRKHPAIREMPDVAAFGFWCRKAGICQLKEEYGKRLSYTLGRGVTLHFAPSNIPVLFAFSMAAAILAGNTVVVKLSSYQEQRVQTVIDCLVHTLQDYPEWQKRIVLFRYGHDKEVTDWISSLCDVRIIWGGDASLSEIRRSMLPPRALELPFADRTSVAVLRASHVLEAESLVEGVKGFYNDTFLYDQNACSSPRMVYWLGTSHEVMEAKERFWNMVSGYCSQYYTIDPFLAVKKWEQALCMAATEQDTIIQAMDNVLLRVTVMSLSDTSWEKGMPGGYFIEAQGESLDGLLPVLTGKCQTVTCYGINPRELADYGMANKITGADRIVEFGHALDFSLQWDGIDLISYMSRRILFS